MPTAGQGRLQVQEGTVSAQTIIIIIIIIISITSLYMYRTYILIIFVLGGLL